MSKSPNNSYTEHVNTSPLYGDAEILFSISKSTFWTTLFSKGQSSKPIILREFINLVAAMLSWSTSVFFRYRYGNRTIGFIFSFLTLFFLIAINAKGIWNIFAPLFPFFVPIIHFAKGNDYWSNTIIQEVHSVSMLWHIGGFIILSLFHTLSTYLGFSKTQHTTKRGTSLIHYFLFRKTEISEYFFCTIVEPLIISIIGLCLWFFAGDKYFALFLFASALTTFIFEFKNKGYRDQLRS